MTTGCNYSPPRIAHLRPVSRSPAASPHCHFLDHRQSSPRPSVVPPGFICVPDFNKHSGFTLALASSPFVTVTERSDQHGSSKFHITLRIHPPQRQPHGSTAGEHRQHRTRCPSTGDTGVRAHPADPTADDSRCAICTVGSPGYRRTQLPTRTTPTSSRELLR